MPKDTTPQISRRKLSWIATKPQNLWVFSLKSFPLYGNEHLWKQLYKLCTITSPPPPPPHTHTHTGHSSLMPCTSTSTHTVYVNPSTSGSSYPTFSHISAPPHTFSSSHNQPMSQGEVPGNGAWHLNYSHSPMFPAFTGKSLIHPIRRLHSANRQEVLDLIKIINEVIKIA